MVPNKCEVISRIMVIGMMSGVLLWGVLGCGVRGLPSPPDEPPPIGHGQPAFRRAQPGVVSPDASPTPTAASGSGHDESHGQ